MYPRLSDLLRDLFGVTLPFPIYSFGAMVAVALVVAASVSRREFDRLFAEGRLPAVRMKVRDAKGRVREEPASPSNLVWTMMLIAAVLGIAGSRLFSIFEEWDRFVADPVGTIFSASGLTFWGGLICAALGIAWYLRRKGLPVRVAADGVAPSLLLGYGLGRIGCYLAGDADWGRCSDLADKPGWIPGFLWSETFPRSITTPDAIRFNAVERGDPACVPGVDGVFPTMLYETAACVLLFGVLWAFRKHPFQAGWLFSLYLVFAAVERFLIEIIRVNPALVAGLSQAQLVAIALGLFGVVGLALTTRRALPPTPRAPAPARAPAGPAPSGPAPAADVPATT